VDELAVQREVDQPRVPRRVVARAAAADERQQRDG
jgi:hypothetical protein